MHPDMERFLLKCNLRRTHRPRCREPFMNRLNRKTWDPDPTFMDVHQLSDYLHLNEKKIYAMVGDGSIPATKITGKWLFPKELVDRWLLESAHDGVLNDRLMISGGDDALMHRVVNRLARDNGRHALISYAPTNTRLGLELLQSGRIDLCLLNWGPAEESDIRHAALMKLHSAHPRWVLVRGFHREQGLLANPDTLERYPTIEALLRAPLRWALRQSGSGSRRFILDTLRAHDIGADDISETVSALSEREAAAAVGMGIVDIAPGTRNAATEFGLGFVPLGWERFDIALDKRKWFRHLVQSLITILGSTEIALIAQQLGGYKRHGLGELVWGDR
ncbi:MAG: helix-turn-helix domain-containing protein [Proteobacteria bacterium]|nr:MAG: helix-turn-helix domain-containing protein [Pseudomonadota bacterium]